MIGASASSGMSVIEGFGQVYPVRGTGVTTKDRSLCYLLSSLNLCEAGILRRRASLLVDKTLCQTQEGA